MALRIRSALLYSLFMEKSVLSVEITIFTLLQLCVSFKKRSGKEYRLLSKYHTLNTTSHSVLQGISPSPEILTSPLFTLPPPPPPPPKKILNLSDPPFMSYSPQNFGELDFPHPLEMYPRPKKQRLVF